jgi:hypothetical protein
MAAPKGVPIAMRHEEGCKCPPCQRNGNQGRMTHRPNCKCPPCNPVTQVEMATRAAARHHTPEFYERREAAVRRRNASAEERARRDALAAERRAHRAAINAQRAESRAISAEIKAAKAWMDTAREEWKAKKREANLTSLHRKWRGFDEEAWTTKLDEIGWACEICGRPVTIETACVDHDYKKAAMHGHLRGRSCLDCFRGVLCGRCNTRIGMGDDDPEVLRRDIAYLETRV